MGTDDRGVVGDQPSGTDKMAETPSRETDEASDETPDEAPDETPDETPDKLTARDPPELTLDTLLEVAQNERRRRILTYLAARDGAVDIGELAEHLAGLEYECPDAGPTSDQRKRMYVGLYQGHLPKMDEMGVVEFDKDRGQIEPGPHARRVTRFVERATGDEPPWPRFYLGLVLLAGVLFIVPFVWAASTAVADLGLAVVLSLLVLTAGGHLYWRRQAPF